MLSVLKKNMFSIRWVLSTPKNVKNKGEENNHKFTVYILPILTYVYIIRIHHECEGGIE